MVHPVRAIAFVLASLAAAPAFAISLQVEASTTWAKNISRTAALADQKDALRNEAHLTASHLQPLATGLSLIAEADASFETVPRFLRNTLYGAGATVQLRKKFGLGAFAPVLATEVALQRRDAHIAGDNGWLAGGALRFSQRFTDSWRASLTGDRQQHYASHATFDIRHHRFFGTLTWDITRRWQLTYGRGSLWGNLRSNIPPQTFSNIRARLVRDGTSFEVTDSYGLGWVSTRPTVRSDFWWLELSPALGPNTSLPMRYERSFTVTGTGATYRQDLWTLGLLHRF